MAYYLCIKTSEGIEKIRLTSNKSDIINNCGRTIGVYTPSGIMYGQIVHVSISANAGEGAGTAPVGFKDADSNINYIARSFKSSSGGAYQRNYNVIYKATSDIANVSISRSYFPFGGIIKIAGGKGEDAGGKGGTGGVKIYHIPPEPVADIVLSCFFSTTGGSGGKGNDIQRYGYICEHPSAYYYKCNSTRDIGYGSSGGSAGKNCYATINGTSIVAYGGGGGGGKGGSVSSYSSCRESYDKYCSMSSYGTSTGSDGSGGVSGDGISGSGSTGGNASSGIQAPNSDVAYIAVCAYTE